MKIVKLKSDQRIIRLALAFVLLLILSLAFFVNPEMYPWTDCAFKNTTGYSCPSCGLSRSFHAGTHFQFGKSFAFHLMGPFLLGLTAFLFLKFLAEGLSGNSLKFYSKPKYNKLIIIVFFAIWLLFWLYRLILEIS